MIAAIPMVRPEDVQLPPRRLNASERRNSRIVHRMPRTLVEALDDMARCVVVIEGIDRQMETETHWNVVRKLTKERNAAYLVYLQARAHVTEIRKRDETSTWKYTRGPRHGWG